MGGAQGRVAQDGGGGHREEWHRMGGGKLQRLRVFRCQKVSSKTRGKYVKDEQRVPFITLVSVVELGDHNCHG